jgi:aldehyde dehydrogenase (NAD+)
MLRFYADMAIALHGETIDNSLPGEYVSFTLKEPVGVVGAIIPWNGPLTASIWKISPALATDCTVVLKPAEEAPLTPLRLAELCLEAGVPPGVVNVVPGYGETAGAALAAHMDVDKVAFTGSHLTGQSIIRASAGNLKRVSLELGRKSPDIVFADADLDQAVPGSGMAVFANSGQICSAGTRLFVEHKIYDEFVGRVAAFGKTLRVGDGSNPETQVGPLVSEEQLKRVTGYLAIGRQEGAHPLSGGDREIPRRERGDNTNRLTQDRMTHARLARNDAPVDATAFLRIPLDDVAAAQDLQSRLGDRLALLQRHRDRHLLDALAHEPHRFEDELGTLCRTLCRRGA